MSFMSDECHQAKASPHHTILRTESHASPDPVISIRAAMRSVRQQQLGDHDRRQVGEAGGDVGHDRCVDDAQAFDAVDVPAELTTARIAQVTTV
jgi:hypothetical protein